MFHTERNPSFISAPQQRQRLLARGALLESQVINDRIDIRTSSQANNATTSGRGMSFALGMIGECMLSPLTIAMGKSLTVQQVAVENCDDETWSYNAVGAMYSDF